MNGGNGSTWLNEVKFLTDEEITNLTPSQFVAFDIEINAIAEEIFEVMTGKNHSKALQEIFDPNKTLDKDWHKSSHVNFKYLEDQYINAAFAGNLWGCLYIQIDIEKNDCHYVEKFLLLESDTTDLTTPRFHAAHLKTITSNRRRS